MPKRLFLIMLIIPILLVACGGETQTPVAEDPVPVDTIPVSTDTVPAPTPTDEPEPTEEVPESEDESEIAANLPEGDCTLVSAMPDAPPQYLEFFTPTDTDWVTGTETARVTFVEYSDFQ